MTTSTPLESDLAQACRHALHGSASACVAFSAGADSTALLVASVEALGPSQVHAVHINHGLQAAALDFERHARDTCSRLGCSLDIIAVDAQASRGQSPEAVARDARYLALAQAAQSWKAPCLLGQHAQDQTETLLLALSRGLGVMGLSGMGESFIRHDVQFLRPFLHISSTHLRTYLQAHGASWVEDPTNSDVRFSRNLVRAQILPVLEQSFPHFKETSARSMSHCAAAQEILNDMALMDLQANPQLELIALRTLSGARLLNLLRYWLAHVHQAYPTQPQMEEAQKQIRAATTRNRKISIKCAHGFLSRSDDFQGLVFKGLSAPDSTGS